MTNSRLCWVFWKLPPNISKKGHGQFLDIHHDKSHWISTPEEGQSSPAEPATGNNGEMNTNNFEKYSEEKRLVVTRIVFIYYWMKEHIKNEQTEAKCGSARTIARMLHLMHPFHQAQKLIQEAQKECSLLKE